MPRPSRWNEIVDVAAKAFREKGFAATSLEDIAREVGMWKGSLYHYINSKEDLLFAVVSEPADQILAEVLELRAMDLPATEKVRRAARSHATVLQRNFVYASVYLQEIAGRHRSEEWSHKDRQYVDALEHIIAQGVEDGAFDRGVDPRIATLALIGSLNWLTHWYHPDGVRTAPEIAEQICDLFLSGMLTRGAGTQPTSSGSRQPVANDKTRSRPRKAVEQVGHVKAG
jgi:AcrR family transcriptional regulator